MSANLRAFFLQEGSGWTERESLNEHLIRIAMSFPPSPPPPPPSDFLLKAAANKLFGFPSLYLLSLLASTQPEN